MIFGSQLFRDDRILDAFANLVADELREQFIGLLVAHNVAEIAEPFGKSRVRPQLLEPVLPFFRSHVEDRPRIEVVDKPGEGFARSFENFRIAGFDFGLGLRIDRPVAQGRAIIRRALEDRQMANLLGDFRDELNRRGARADDADAFAGELDAFLGPSRGMKRLALEALDRGKAGDVLRGKDTDCRDEESCPYAGSILEPDFPVISLFIVGSCSDSGVESDVAAQVEFIRHVIEVALVLRLAGKVLLPIPLLQELLRKRVTVAVTLGIESRARVTIPGPCAAHSAASLVNPHREPESTQTNQLIQSGNPGANDDRVKLFDWPRVRCRRGL